MNPFDDHAGETRMTALLAAAVFAAALLTTPDPIAMNA